jgi:hypothetical protein
VEEGPKLAPGPEILSLETVFPVAMKNGLIQWLRLRVSQRLTGRAENFIRIVCMVRVLF